MKMATTAKVGFIGLCCGVIFRGLHDTDSLAMAGLFSLTLGIGVALAVHIVLKDAKPSKKPEPYTAENPWGDK